MNRLTPLSIKNVTPYVNPDPYGVDLAVNGLQAAFAAIPWMEKAFGRAVKRSVKVDGSARLFPACFIDDGKDFYDMLLIDNYKSFCFFYARDPEAIVDHVEYVRNTITRPLSAIFWMNLQEVDTARSDDFLGKLKSEIIKAVNEARYPIGSSNDQVKAVTIIDINDEPENIYQGFTVDLEETQTIYFPYRGLRIDFNVTYLEGC